MNSVSKVLEVIHSWNPPEGWQKISVLDAHTGGEPLRIVLAGLPEMKGDTVLERRTFMKNNFDHLRRALMFEPRGHADQYGAVVMPHCSPDADFSVLFLHNEGYSTMCGHAIIALTTVMLETGAVEMQYPETTLRIEVPSGIVTAMAECRHGRVTNVRFHNVPSFASMLGEKVHVPGLGQITFDLGFGGAFYAYVDAKACGVRMVPQHYRDLIEVGKAIKKAIIENFPIIHPFEKDLSFLYGTIFLGPAMTPGVDSRNVCIFADGEVDRSPTGSGVAGRMAIHHAKGELKIGQKMTIESLLGSVFTGSVVETTTFGPYEAVIPQVEGQAWISGTAKFYIDPNDPFKEGFILR
ncbi:proline racemase family protein [Desulfofustis glycolicus]|uniref:Proline racemase n=1 Tax=Desulfofustis glycolicus DSM 9705 TaxID=1121409 RepID=A0A1M5V629_9BACT|nr:proline racemase family protein [Desulfofustis glycolicus]MCB2214963.1 proline racemase family protein [Desulfobulbaceae bacterium]SHH70727.1 proline racemase [Desulfofustis glycolicus DSM 9705]